MAEGPATASAAVPANGPYLVRRRDSVTDVAIDELSACLAVLDRHAEPGDHEALRDLRGRITAGRLRVMVAGEAKRGKSTLLNRLPGRDILPTGVTPVTAIATTVAPVDGEEYVEVTYHDGQVQQVPVGELPKFVTEHLNPGNVRDIREVTLALRSPLLGRHLVELVDTPGTGSVYRHNTDAAESAFDSLDAAIVVLAVDPPISAAESALLLRIAGHSVHTFVVLNKADQLSPDELTEMRGFTEQICSELLSSEVRVYACSARLGLQDSGFRAFAEDLESYLAESGRADAVTALRSHIARQARAMRDSVQLTARAFDMATTDATDQVALFRSRVESIGQHRERIGDECAATERRARRDLDASAAATRRRVAEAALAAARAVTAQADGETAAAVIAERGRGAAVATMQACVTQWRNAWTRQLADALGEVVEAGTSELRRQLDELRAAARELLGVELAVEASPHALPDNNRFRFDFGPGIGWELPGAATIKRLLPGSRRRAQEHVLAEIPELTDRQFGRARSDLTDRFRDSVRDAVRTLTGEHDRVVARVGDALAAAARIASDATENQRVERDTLAARRESLTEVLETLGQG